ncbi:hypothetical protein SEMRO_3002_G341950.1 [Seminavis robusta]|uniref:Uncharacterized protein n=1 Tax=Seminavis robusta TaxID=568900 RepID=A0A9N8HYR0_9STRA|nr:hypothetical protein SEMRO_3002_G341950.1 [Seminavis robusta]|eukprot:Sro3002_g341950.1 n/a (177) ;mRNA; r:6528-7058
MPLFLANTFLFKPQQLKPLPQDEVETICQSIQQGLVDAVNSGANACISIHVHPNHFISTGDLKFLTGVEGTITSQSMHHLELVSDQGARRVTVHFVGGGSLFVVAHDVDDVDSEPEPEQEQDTDDDGTDNEDHGGDEDNGSEGSSSGSSTRMDPNNESNASSDFDGAFVGFSQLSI